VRVVRQPTHGRGVADGAALGGLAHGRALGAVALLAVLDGAADLADRSVALGVARHGGEDGARRGALGVLADGLADLQGAEEGASASGQHGPGRARQRCAHAFKSGVRVLDHGGGRVSSCPPRVTTRRY